MFQIHVTMHYMQAQVYKLANEITLYWALWLYYFTDEVNPSLDKPQMNFNGGLPKLGIPVATYDSTYRVFPIWFKEMFILEMHLILF